MEEISPQLKVSEILPVGGFNEGTKILAANEYDFLVVIEELSKPEVFTVESDEDYPGKVKLKLNSVQDSDGKWRKFSKDGYLKCFDAVLQTSIEDSFGFRALEAINKLKQNKGRAGVRENSRIMYYGNPPEPIYKRTRPADQVAFIKGAEVRYPNVLLEFILDGEHVTADLCPAIRYTNITDCFNKDFCFDKKLSDAVIEKGSILLVGSDNCRFRVTYTETEVEFVKNKMKKRHKQLYIFLKAIAHFFTRIGSALPSYVLKIVCIKHDLMCKIEDGEKRFSHCFDELMEALIESLNDRYLSSVFDGRMNILSVVFDTILPVYRQVHVIPALRQIRQLCCQSDVLPPKQFLDRVKIIVESEEAKFNLVQLIGLK